ncbi:hypothetical protein N7537_009295 [Penicillium hordei]|uniref:Uncharacterized protein n=1 Tax=Penicillium hordei TaxID=40994 RepID=A0AAD6DSK9_9EURO|nr:uncharacterized protein N7537_009295 [Penicillium hordei]KAJ5592391.1 hypothetical protein N7537_009295 [Penicillium hordei]
MCPCSASNIFGIEGTESRSNNHDLLLGNRAAVNPGAIVSRQPSTGSLVTIYIQVVDASPTNTSHKRHVPDPSLPSRTLYTRWYSSERAPWEIATTNVLCERNPSTNNNPAFIRKVMEANPIVKAAV